MCTLRMTGIEVEDPVQMSRILRCIQEFAVTNEKKGKSNGIVYKYNNPELECSIWRTPSGYTVEVA